MDFSVSGDLRRRIECSFSRNERTRKPAVPDLTYPETLLILLIPSRKLESAVRNPRLPPRVFRFMGRGIFLVLFHVGSLSQMQAMSEVKEDSE